MEKYSIGFAQLNFTICDFEQNLEKITKAYLELADTTELAVFSELSLSGYYPKDLLEDDKFQELQTKAIRELQKITVGKKSWLVVGAVTRNNTGIGKKWFNSLLVIGNGVVLGIYNKHLLPTYNIFDENRHFEAGREVLVLKKNGKKIGFLICEDLWNDSTKDYSDNPVEKTMSNNIDLLVSINASPSNLEKSEQRIQLMRKITTKYNVPLLYVNQVGANDEIVFDGASFFITKDGDITFVAPHFEEKVGTVSEIKTNYWQSNIGIDNKTNMEIMLNHTILGLKDYMEKQGFSKVVVGSSGGIDSALTIALAVKALGAENVSAITMPSKYSSSGSVTDSVTLCENLGVKLYTHEIENEVLLSIENFEKSFGEKPSGLTIENIQARIRGRILMEFSNNYGALVLSTGNKSEMAVGYATLYGDMNGGLNLIGDLYKMEVYELSKYVNSLYGYFAIPEAIINKEPSAELREGQKDSDSLPPYPILDAILRNHIEFCYNNKKQLEEDKKILENISEGLIISIKQKVKAAEFKRRQAPPIIRIHKLSFGSGRQIPIVHKGLV